jgi:hypothetical protein
MGLRGIFRVIVTRVSMGLRVLLGYFEGYCKKSFHLFKVIVKVFSGLLCQKFPWV